MSHDQPHDAPHPGQQAMEPPADVILDGDRVPAKTSPADAVRAVVKQSKFQVVRQLESARSMFAAVAPEGANVDRMLALWRSAITQDARIRKASPKSILLSVREAVRLDLEPGGPLGLCWINAFGNQAQLMLGYRGMVTLAARAGIMIESGAIYETDLVQYREGTDPVLEVTRPWPPVGDRGRLVAGYAIAIMPDGRRKAKVLGYDDPITQRARRASHSGGGKKPAQSGMDPWEDQWLAKTAIRRLCAEIELSPDLQKLSIAGEHADQGVVHEEPMIEGEWLEDVIE